VRAYAEARAAALDALDDAYLALSEMALWAAHDDNPTGARAFHDAATSVLCAGFLVHSKPEPGRAAPRAD
jgi:hypothetical protein